MSRNKPYQEYESLEKPSHSFFVIIQGDRSPDVVFHVVLQTVVLAWDEEREMVTGKRREVAFVTAALDCDHFKLAHDK